MRTFVFGVGASIHAGYPLARSMGNGLFAWMKTQADIGLFTFKSTAESLQSRFGNEDDIERMLTEADKIIFGFDGAQPESCVATAVAGEKMVPVQARL